MELYFEVYEQIVKIVEIVLHNQADARLVQGNDIDNATNSPII